MSDVAVAPELKKLGDEIASLTLKQAKELSDYIKEAYGIEPATSGGGGGGGAVAVAPAAAVEQTEFDVVLANVGDKKLDVVKAVKNITNLSLMDAKKLVESSKPTIKEKVSKEDAAKVKAELEAVGATVELK
jgi:large subunit ribosomal protein L7/L12